MSDLRSIETELAFHQQELERIKREKIRKASLEAKMLDYRMNPAKWLEERLGEDAKSIYWDRYPGYGDHEWDGDRNPLAQAWETIARGRWAAIRSATSTGKTHMLARVVIWFMDVYENPLVVTSAPKESQLKMNLWSEISRCWSRFQELRPHSVKTTLRIRKDISHPLFKESAEAVGFVAGVGATEDSATKAQGFHRENMLIILEEQPGMDEAVMNAFINTATGGNNMILGVGNPDHSLDPLAKFCDMKSVSSFRVSAYDHPNYVLDSEIIKGAVTRRSVQIRADKYGHGTRFYNSRVRGITPEEPEDAMIKGAWIERACDPKHIPADDGSYNAIGVDVANSLGGDKGGVCYGRGNTVYFIKEFVCPNANHLAYNLFMPPHELEKNGYLNYGIPLITDYDIILDQHIGVDPIGVGVATINTLHDNGIFAVGLQGGMWEGAIKLDPETQKPIYKFQNRRSQMMWELREDLREGKIRILTQDRELIDQIKKEGMAHRYTTKSGTIVVYPKDGPNNSVKKLLGGKSPTYIDILAYWNHVRKGYYGQSTEYMPIYSREI